MVHVVTFADRARYAEALVHMHRDRKAVFVDRLGWDLPIVGDALEVDRFDTDAAVYLLALDAAGRHEGSVRLLPTTQPHLLSEVFPHLCEHEPPRDPETWEITRLCTSPAAPDPNRTRTRLMVAVTEFALLYGVRRYVCMSHMQYLSQVLAVGWDCEPLGMPQVDPSGQLTAAIRIKITPETLSLVRARAGLSLPILRWEARHAA